MSNKVHLWLRDECKKGEQRTALPPSCAAELLKAGYKITVESSETRIFPDSEYEKVGCTIVKSQTWPQAPEDAFILGLKELPLENQFPGIPHALKHKHIYFAHCYKGQSDWKETLGRFVEGNGELIDLEFLNFDNGRRVAAFGFSAGFAGMAIGFLNWIHQQIHGNKEFLSLTPFASKDLLISHIKSELEKVPGKKKPSVLVLGALGRSGRGAVAVCEALGIDAIQWDLNETKLGGPFEKLAQVDILVNCIYLMGKIPPFLDEPTLEKTEKENTRKLSVFIDVSCDVTNPNNPFKFTGYNNTTTFEKPVLRLYQYHPVLKPLDIVSIDHLPTFIPRESSFDFAEALLPHLKNIHQIDYTQKPNKEMGKDLTNGTEEQRVFLRARALFAEKVEELKQSD